MSTSPLAELLAQDLRDNLRGRAPGLSDVYGFCLWTDYLEGDFLASVATEAQFERERGLPGNASQPELLLGATGPRWNVGNWLAFPTTTS